jgi:hypothetical protein
LRPMFRGEEPLLPSLPPGRTCYRTILSGLLSKGSKPSPENGVTVFLRGLEKRGPDNHPKRSTCQREMPFCGPVRQINTVLADRDSMLRIVYEKNRSQKLPCFT